MELRVQKILSNYGFCSRRKAETLIEEGRVRVNDRIIHVGDKATEKDKIFVDNKLIEGEKKVYLMFNKPLNCICALEDKQYRTIMYYIKIKERVFPIGRLDYNTTGLILLTNDGDFANNIMHPRYEIDKTYVAEIDKPIIDAHMEKMEKGIVLEDGLTSPARVKKIEENMIEVTIHEGKKRIVRRMLKQLGYKVITLERARIGKLDLGNLKVGQYRNLNEEDKKKIFLHNKAA